MLTADNADDLVREFQTLAARIDAQTKRTYALVYCTPSGGGDHTGSVRIVGAADQVPASHRFNANGLSGCQSAQDIEGLCNDKSCGGLGCGACDDRTDSCNGSDQCQSFCETDAVTAAVTLNERCDFPNPRGYVQYCEQDISTRCGETCTDLANDSANCGTCGLDCGLNVVGIDGVRTDGVTCQSGVCNCATGWFGAQCNESICGDGVIAAGAEQCDDGNLDPDDGCSSTCDIELYWSCVDTPSQCDGIRGDVSRLVT